MTGAFELTTRHRPTRSEQAAGACGLSVQLVKRSPHQIAHSSNRDSFSAITSLLSLSAALVATWVMQVTTLSIRRLALAQRIALAALAIDEIDRT